MSRFETFTLAISEILKCWNKIAAEELKPYDLKGSYVVYISSLFNHPEGITSKDLCYMCAKDKALVSRAVSVMEKKGIVTRESVSDNNYRALIKLTESGKNAASSLEHRIKLAVDCGGAGLTEEHREIFYSSLKTICENLKKISKEGLPK